MQSLRFTDECFRTSIRTWVGFLHLAKLLEFVGVSVARSCGRVLGGSAFAAVFMGW
jgi:hypothetical protein